MFNSIVESVLNEISAEDAYVKYYSDIPKDVFDGLLHIYGGKFDALFKFVLKSINDYITPSMIDDAKLFLKKYKGAGNNTRIEFLKKFKNGDYEDLVDAMQGLQEIEKEGVSTAKSRQDEGYIELYNDDNYLLTATLTYEANQHFYGNSKWCTSSDRFGKRDGWFYFLSYVFGVKDIYDTDIYGNLGTKKYPIKNVLVQFTDKTQNKIYQVQFCKNKTFGQICDFDDRPVRKDEFVDKIFPKSLNGILRKKILELISIEEKCFETEYKYQTGRNEYVFKKREIIRERNEALLQKLGKKITTEIEQKAKFVESKFDSVVNSNLIYNKDFIKQLLVNTDKITEIIGSGNYIGNKEKIGQLEKIIASQGYCFVDNVYKAYGSIIEVRVKPILGHIPDVDSEEGITPKIFDTFSCCSRYFRFSKITVNGSLIMFIETNDDSIDNIYKSFDNIEILSIIDIEKTKDKLTTINLKNLIPLKFYGNFSFLKLLEKQIDGGYFLKLVNLLNKRSVSFEIKGRTMYNYAISAIIPIGDLLFCEYNDVNFQQWFTVIDTKKMEVINEMKCVNIGNTNCYLVLDSNTKDLYILTDGLHKTGVKLVNGDVMTKPKMYGARFIVFTNNSNGKLDDGCKVFDCEENKTIIMNGKIEDNLDFGGDITVVTDIDTGKSVELK